MQTRYRTMDLIKQTAGRLFLLVGISALSVLSARAQGFSIYEHGSCAMGRAGAVVAASCDDGSSILYNPAAITNTSGLVVTGGVTVIAASGDFTNDALNGKKTELDNDPIPVPHGYLTYGFSDRLAAGIGVYAPYGLGTVWPMDFEGRFLSFDSGVETIYIQPTVAYRVTPQLSLGAGLTYAIGSVRLNKRVDLSTQRLPGGQGTFALIGVPARTDFAEAGLEATGATGIGGNFGIQFEANEMITLGARYMQPVKLEYEGDATFEQVNTNILLPAGNPLNLPAGTRLDALLAPQFADGAALGDQRVKTEITMPAQFVAGVSFQATPALLLMADYQWTDWSSFEEIFLDFENAATTDVTQHENYEDTHAIRLGADYAVNDQFNVRAGFLTHTAAAPDQTVTPLLPEAGRWELTVGLGVRPLRNVELNAAYQFLHQNEREGRVADDPTGAPPTTALNVGTYNFGAHIFATTVTLRF